MAKFSVLIPAVTGMGGGMNSKFIVSLVAGKENSHQKFKPDIKRVTVLRYFVFVQVESHNV